MKKLLFALLSIIIPFNIIFPQSSWIWQNPLPNGNTYNCIKFINNNTGFVVGELGMLYKTTNGGNNWNKIAFPFTGTLNSIFFVNQSTGWICGVQGTLYKTTDCGNNWFNKNAGIFENIADIYFVNESTGFFSRKNGNTVGISKTTDSGETWIYTDFPNISTGETGGIFFVNSLTGWTIYSSTNIAGTVFSVSKTTNCGNSWANYTVYDIMGSGITFKGIYFINDMTGFALTNERLSRTTDGGMNWTNIMSTNFYDRFYSAIGFYNQTKGIVASNKIYKTSNSGLNWYIADTTFSVYYKSLSLIDSNNIWIAGEGGLIVKSTNSGSNWINETPGKRNVIYETNFPDSLNGYACGEKGLVLKTTNKGTNWIELNNSVFNLKQLNCVKFINSNTGWIGSSDSGIIFKTTNGGNNWQKQYLSTNGNIQQIYFSQSGTGYALFGVYSIVYKSTNFGNNWAVCYNPNLAGYKLSVCNESTLYLCDGQIEKTTNGGINWTVLPLPSGTTKAYDIFFLNENTGWGNFYSNPYDKIYKTTNGGTNWQYSANYRTSGICFINANEGYINLSSYQGYIGYTSNSGANWVITKITSDIIHSITMNGKDLWVSGNYGMLLKGQDAYSTDIKCGIFEVPQKSFLSQNYPNPFNPVTKITYSLMRNSFVSIKIFDLLGREIQTLVNKNQVLGEYETQFISVEIPSGIYLYSLFVNGLKMDTKKMILLK